MTLADDEDLLIRSGHNIVLVVGVAIIKGSIPRKVVSFCWLTFGLGIPKNGLPAGLAFTGRLGRARGQNQLLTLDGPKSTLGLNYEASPSSPSCEDAPMRL